MVLEYPIHMDTMQRPYRWVSVLLFSLVLVAAHRPALAQDGVCGPITNAFGPFDYRVEKGNNLHLVESAHFTPIVEALIRGTTGYVGGDLDYTLRAFPNHHRALLAVMRYGEKTKSPKPNDLRYSVECYFTRALQFKPDDTTVRLLYATYLGKNSRETEAAQQLGRAKALAKDNPFTHYNIGLVYFDLKQYDKALEQAHIAEDLGFLQTGLRDQLTAVGKWKNAQPRTAAADAPASAPAAASSAPAAP